MHEIYLMMYQLQDGQFITLLPDFVCTWCATCCTDYPWQYQLVWHRKWLSTLSIYPSRALSYRYTSTQQFRPGSWNFAFVSICLAFLANQGVHAEDATLTYLRDKVALTQAERQKKMRIATLSAADLDRIVYIEQSAHTHPWSKNALATAFDHIPSLAYIYMISSSVSVIILDTLDALELPDIAIAPSHQDKGYGYALLQHIMMLARQKNTPSYLKCALQTNKRLSSTLRQGL